MAPPVRPLYVYALSVYSMSRHFPKHLLTPSILSTLAEKGEMPVTHRDIDQAVDPYEKIAHLSNLSWHVSNDD